MYSLISIATSCSLVKNMVKEIMDWAKVSLIRPRSKAGRSLCLAYESKLEIRVPIIQMRVKKLLLFSKEGAYPWFQPSSTGNRWSEARKTRSLWLRLSMNKKWLISSLRWEAKHSAWLRRDSPKIWVSLPAMQTRHGLSKKRSVIPCWSIPRPLRQSRSQLKKSRMIRHWSLKPSMHKLSSGIKTQAFRNCSAQIVPQLRPLSPKFRLKVSMTESKKCSKTTIVTCISSLPGLTRRVVNQRGSARPCLAPNASMCFPN